LPKKPFLALFPRFFGLRPTSEQIVPPIITTAYGVALCYWMQGLRPCLRIPNGRMPVNRLAWGNALRGYAHMRHCTTRPRHYVKNATYVTTSTYVTHNPKLANARKSNRAANRNIRAWRVALRLSFTTRRALPYANRCKAVGLVYESPNGRMPVNPTAPPTATSARGALSLRLSFTTRRALPYANRCKAFSLETNPVNPTNVSHRIQYYICPKTPIIHFETSFFYGVAPGCLCT